VGCVVSILVLLEAAHRRRRTYPAYSWEFRFQSLFCWKRLIGLRRPTHGHHRLDVSILVLLEAAHRRAGRKLLSMRKLVSILVLLEAAHRLRSNISRHDLPTCFNPCSVGSGSSAACPIEESARAGKVSILVLLEAAHRRDEYDIVRRDPLEFQSLFCWKRLIGTSAASSVRHRSTCFNPCSVGSGSSATFLGFAPNQAKWFQSLFCWKRLIGARYRIVPS